MELFCSGIIVLNFWKRYQSLQNGSYAETEVYAISEDLKDTAERVLRKTDYIPPPYCILEYHGQLQTFIQCLTRNLTRLCRSYVLFPYAVRFERELLVLQDGGTVALDWANKGNGEDDLKTKPLAPIVILHHGLVGDSQSEYIYHLSWTLLSAGYRVVVMVARGCGGLKLTSGEIFAGRRTSDVESCIDRVKQLYPGAKRYWVGFSLGAALTLQYVATPHANTQTMSTKDTDSDGKSWRGPLTAAVSVCPPWDVYMNACNPSAIAYFWMSLIVAPLKAHYLGHRSYLNATQPERFGMVSLWDILWAPSMCDFDNLIYPTHLRADGTRYETLKCYYDDVSPVHCAHLVHTPTIVLTAKDDPVCMHQAAPTDPAQLGPGLVVVSFL